MSRRFINQLYGQCEALAMVWLTTLFNTPTRSNFAMLTEIQKGYSTSTLPGRREVKGKLARAMMKPMIWGNHQNLFMFFTYVTAIGSTVYMVFYHDYKLDDHCFMPIRRYVARKKKEFFTSSLNTDTIQKLEEQSNKETSSLVTSGASKQQTILK